MRLALALLLGMSAVGVRAEPAAAPATLEERARSAVARGRDWLERQQSPDGTFPSLYPSAGCHALALWTLLECGAPTADPAVQRTLGWLRGNADPARGLGQHAQYGAALTLVALQSYHYRRAAEAETFRSGEDWVRAARRGLTSADRAWVERLVRYVRACSTGTHWLYSAMPGRPAELADAGLPVAAPPPGAEAGSPRWSGVRMKWGGDNSNAQYGWMGIRAATLLGVTLVDDRFFHEELERLLRSPEPGIGSAVSIARDGDRGFPGLWDAPEVRRNVTRLGWGYGNGDPLPTMTTGCIASLIYAWQEAEERGLMTGELRVRAREAVLGGIADLFAATRERVEEG